VEVAEAVRGAGRWKRNGPEAEKRPQTGANRQRRWSRRAERAKKPAGEGAKDQARTFDPGMAASRGATVTGEGKTDSSTRPRPEEQAAVSWKALILELDKPASGERNGETPGAFGCNVQCGACPR